MAQPEPDELLECWKVIAAYLKRDVRTVQRWEHTRGLPVHRTPGGDKAAVYALKSELSEWLLHATPERPLSSSSEDSPSTPSRLANHGLSFVVWCTLGGLCLISVIWMFRGPASADPASGFLKFVPLTADGGWKDSPRFSPDGEWIAYHWDGPLFDNFDIYIKGVAPNSTPLRLTDHPGDDHSPAWSPDGRQIAFSRISQDGTAAIFLIPATGGPERKLVRLEGTPKAQGISEAYLGAVSWSPDGETLTFSESEDTKGPARLIRMSISTQKKEVLTAPPGGTTGDVCPEYSPDGNWIAFLRVASGKTDVWLLSAVSGKERRLTSLEYFHGGGPVWSADGGSILFSRGHPPRLHRVNVASGEISSVAGLGPGANQASTFGSRLVVEQWHFGDTDIRIVPVSASATSESEKLIHSSFTDFEGDVSSDGTQVVFVSYREQAGIWKCNIDGSKPTPLTDFAEACGTPRWSPDGTKVLFDSLHSGNWDLWIVDSEGGPPIQLTTQPSDENMGTWSQDGKWIYFSSNRTGSYEIHRMPSEGGEAVRLTETGGFYAVESRDGRHVYCSKSAETGPLFRLPVSGGGREEIVLPEVWGRDWAVGERGIYFASHAALGPCGTGCSPEDYRINFLDLEAKRTREIFRKSGPFGHTSLTVSPDERFLLFAEGPSWKSELMLAQDFR